MAFFEQNGVWTFAIGLGCGPIPVFGFVSSGTCPFCICHQTSKAFEGIQKTTLVGEELFGGCPGHVRLLASHGRWARVSRYN